MNRVAGGNSAAKLLVVSIAVNAGKYYYVLLLPNLSYQTSKNRPCGQFCRPHGRFLLVFAILWNEGQRHRVSHHPGTRMRAPGSPALNREERAPRDAYCGALAERPSDPCNDRTDAAATVVRDPRTALSGSRGRCKLE